MELTVMTLYGLLLVLQIGLLIFNLRKRTWWGITLTLEFVCILVSGIAAWIFDHLPGNGVMPGITYFAEWGISVAAMMLYGVMFLVSLLFCGIQKRK